MNRIPHPTVGRIQYEFARGVCWGVLTLSGIVLGLNFMFAAVDRHRAELPFSVRETAREMFGNAQFPTTNLPTK